MRQVVQSYGDGRLRVESVPAPICRAGTVLVRTAYSLVSTGTERMKVSQARMGLVAKARARPDQVRKVVEEIRRTGLRETCTKVRERLAALTPLGYSLAGFVEEVGPGLDEFRPGERVACAGEGLACHAEFVAVPRNLCVSVPDNVDLRDAAFATVGAIALHGVRQADVRLGETVLVIGLGLVGLLAVQILKAAGCRVIGLDTDPARAAAAETCGADLAAGIRTPNLEQLVRRHTAGRGADAAYIAASTRSAEPLALAGRALRDRGRVVVVGMVPIAADWQLYYRKELAVVLARSYGPGRYDPVYEHKGVDYPIGYVRWTERRNLQEFLRLVAAGQVQPRRLEPRVHALDEAPQVYEQLRSRETPGPPAVLFEYPEAAARTRRVALPAEPHRHRPPAGRVRIGLIGTGHFASATLLPALRRCPEVALHSACSARGLSARSVAERYGFVTCASDSREVLQDPQVDAVVIATRHDTHASLAAEALRAGKHVFVEKPLALHPRELAEVVAAQRASGRLLMPGFNRRFSPLAAAAREFLVGAGPAQMLCRVNAGALADDSWYGDPDEGGWRIVSEGCHFVDVLQFLCGSPVACVQTELVGPGAGQPHDHCGVLLRFANGALATLLYTAGGDPRFPKERVEAFAGGRTVVIDNFRKLELWSGDSRRPMRKAAAGKGHTEEISAFVQAVARGGPAPLPLEDAVRTTLATFAIVESLQRRLPVEVKDLEPLVAGGAPATTDGNGDGQRD